MSLKNQIISILAIASLFILPHTGIIPNFGYSIPLLFLVWLCLKFFKEGFSDIGFSLKHFKWHALIIGPIAAVLVLCFMQLLIMPALDFIFDFEETQVDLYDFIKANPWNLIFIIIMGWLIGGLYEEIVFHGFIFRQVEKMIPGRYATPISFLIASLIFGAYHFQLGAAGLINAFFVGAVYLGLFLYFKRNLWYAMICHGFYNTLVISLIYLGYL